jgi:hypothetical protein
MPNQLVMANLYMVQDHRSKLLSHFMAFHTMPWLGSMVFLVHTILVSHLATFFYPSYLATQEANVALEVSPTRQVIQTNGLTFGSSPITKVRGA